jgi:hypothetical protein
MLDILAVGVEVVFAAVQGLVGLGWRRGPRSVPSAGSCMDSFGESVPAIVGPSRMPTVGDSGQTQRICIRPTPGESYHRWAASVLHCTAHLHIALRLALVATLVMVGQPVRDVVLQV